MSIDFHGVLNGKRTREYNTHNAIQLLHKKFILPAYEFVPKTPNRTFASFYFLGHCPSTFQKDLGRLSKRSLNQRWKTVQAMNLPAPRPGNLTPRFAPDQTPPPLERRTKHRCQFPLKKTLGFVSASLACLFSLDGSWYSFDSQTGCRYARRDSCDRLFASSSS